VRARFALTGVLLIFAFPADATTRADCERQYTPRRVETGKDVVWLPTPDGLVVRMLEMAKVTPADLVYDLGAGDGKIAIAAAKRFGAQAVGIEYNAELARLAQCLAEVAGVAERARIVRGDIFETDFSAATVLALYLLPELNLRLRPTILEMQPGTRVVSHRFNMGDWQPDRTISTEGGSAYFWIVPAQVAGTWRFRPGQPSSGEEFVIRFYQQFQKLKGSTVQGGSLLRNARLQGAQLEFTFDLQGKPAQFSGRVDGGRIVGAVTREGVASDYVGIWSI